MNIFVTGIGGFLGSRIAEHSKQRGHSVAGVSRRAPEAWRLGTPFDPELLRGADVMVHCAYARGDTNERNIEGTKLVVLAAERAAVARQIFVSSYSARPDAAESYGEIKYSVERFFLQRGYTVVRPGLVAGNGGLFGRSLAQVLRMPILPLVDGGRDRIPVVSTGDLLEALAALIESGRAGAFNLFHPDLVTMRTLIETVNRAGGHRALYVPISSSTALFGLRLLRNLGIRLPVDEDNLRALQRNQQPVHRSDLGEFVAHPCPPEEAIRAAVAEYQNRAEHAAR